MSNSPYIADKRDSKVFSNGFQPPILQAVERFVQLIGNQYAFNGKEYMALFQNVLKKGKTKADAENIDLTDLSARAVKIIIGLKTQVQSTEDSKTRDSKIDEAAEKIVNFMAKLVQADFRNQSTQYVIEMGGSMDVIEAGDELAIFIADAYFKED